MIARARGALERVLGTITPTGPVLRPSPTGADRLASVLRERGDVRAPVEEIAGVLEGELAEDVAAWWIGELEEAELVAMVREEVEPA